ncbi:hypothetical protein MD484_g6778, partial [Candolleomyces efflorescens]
MRFHPILSLLAASLVFCSSAAFTAPPAHAKVARSASTRAASSNSSISVSSSSGAKPRAVGGGLLGNLFPAGSSNSWTTCPASNKALPLSDSTFRPTNVLTSVPHRYANAPDGKRAIRAHYPKGSYTFGHQPQGGFSFYAPGPLSLKNAKEVTFGYSTFFPKGFNFQRGGKLPGLYGGNSESQALGCSGGRRDDACFSARLMWREGGNGEFYTYFPPSASDSANKKLCNVPPSSHCNSKYGASVGRGSFRFPTGRWITVTERVRLNDQGKSNGEIELFVDGKSVINVKGLVLRTSSAGKIRGIQMQTFFGGTLKFCCVEYYSYNSRSFCLFLHCDFRNVCYTVGSDTTFASPKNQDVYFSDFSVAIIKSF